MPPDDIDPEIVPNPGKPGMFVMRFTLGNLVELGAIVIVGASLYYGILNVQNTQGRDIATLQQQVAPIPSMQGDIRVIQSNSATKSAARDAQVGTINSQLSALDNRMDRVETSVDTKLEQMARDIATIQSNVSAIAATIGAPQHR